MSINRMLGTTTAGFSQTDLVPQLNVLSGTAITCLELFCTDGGAQWREPDFPHRLRRETDRLGLRVWSCHAPFGGTDLSALDEERRLTSLATDVEVLALAADLGAGIVVVHAGTEPPAEQPRKPLMNQALRSLEVLCKEASRSGVRLALEALPRTCLGNRVAEIIWMLEQVDGELGVCYDVNHVGLYEDVPASVRALGSRIITTHISDHDGQERHWIPGQGVTDWRAFTTALDEIGYSGPLMHEAFLPNADLSATVAAIAGFWEALGG